MSVETDALGDAALRFAELIRAERTATVEVLENERQAAIQIIEALRNENAKRAKSASGRLVIGFVIGAALGAAAVTLLTQKSGVELRKNLTGNIGSVQGNLRGRLQAAIEIGKQAAAGREQELWGEYRKRVADAANKKPDEPSYL